MPATALAPTKGTPQEQLENCFKNSIAYGDCQIKFSLEKSATGGTDSALISITNNSGQELTYRVKDATEPKNYVKILELYHDLADACKAAEASGNKILAATKFYEKTEKVFDKLQKEYKAEGVKDNLLTDSNRPEAFKNLLALNGDPSLQGFKAEEKIPADEYEKFKDIRRGSQRMLFTDPALLGNGPELEISDGARKQLIIRVPGGRSTDTPPTACKAVFGVEIKAGTSDQELVDLVKQVLPLLKKEKDAASLFQPTAATPAGSELVQKLLETGKLSRLENVDLKGVKWGREDVSYKVDIINVKMENCNVVLYGPFRAKDLVTVGKNHIMLDSPGSVLQNCVFNEGTVLTRDLMSEQSGLYGAVLIGNTKFHCNAYHCDLRQLVFMESLEKGPGSAKWENLKGLIYNRPYASEQLTKMGRNVEQKKFIEHLSSVDSDFSLADLGARLTQLRPDFQATKEVVEIDNRKFDKISLQTSDGDRKVEIHMPQDAADWNKNAAQRIKMRLAYIQEDGRKLDELTTVDAYGAFAASYSWLAWKARVRTQPNNAGMEQISKTKAPDLTLTPKAAKLEDAIARAGLTEARDALFRKLDEKPEFKAEILKYCAAEIGGADIQKGRAAEWFAQLNQSNEYAAVMEQMHNAALEAGVNEKPRREESGDRRSRGPRKPKGPRT